MERLRLPFRTCVQCVGNSIDFSFDNSFAGMVAYGGAQQYFTGDVYSPTFTPGTYSLAWQDGETAPDATLVITAQATTVTPEPSSLMLLGTGVLGVIGVARRRWV